MFHNPIRLHRRAITLMALATAVMVPAAAAAAAPSHRPRADDIPKLQWLDCGDGLECATASVPLDYDQPQGERISLSLARLPATDPEHRIGTLFVNNGGPGNSVIEFMHGDVHGVVPEAVHARFDIVGFDPRGVGESTPVRCFDNSDEQQAFFGALPAFPVSAEEIDQAIAAADELGDRCLQLNGELLEHVGTADVARDLDLLRQAVGDDQLTFAGYSYGGLIAETYAQLFPARVRATLIDGTPDPIALTTGIGADHRLPFSARVGGQQAASDALGLFLDTCQEAGPERCAFASPDTRAKFDAMMRRLLAGPIVVDLPPGIAGPGGPTSVDYAFVVDGLRGALQFPPIWADLAGLYQLTFEAANIDATATAAPAAATSNATESGFESEPVPADGEVEATAEEYNNRTEALLAVTCSETRNPNDPRQWAEFAAEADLDAPYFGADFTWISLPCATWPAHEDDPVAAHFDAVTANPLLFVNSRSDAASPLSGAETAAARMPGAGLLTVEGAGHPASFMPNQCVADAVSSYLIDQVLPAPGATCQAEFVPFS